MDKQMEKRCDELHNLGLKFNGEYYQDTRIGVFVHTTDIMCDTDEKWMKLIEQIKEARKTFSNMPLDDVEKEIAHNCIVAYINANADLPMDKFSKMSDLAERLQPKYYKK